MACAVPYCRSYARLLKKTGETIGFHRFPVNNNLRKKWIDAVGHNNWTPKKHHRICSKHFETNCFVIIKNIKHLLPDAIPTVFQRPLEGSHQDQQLEGNYNKMMLSSNERLPDTIPKTSALPLQCGLTSLFVVGTSLQRLLDAEDSDTDFDSWREYREHIRSPNTKTYPCPLYVWTVVRNTTRAERLSCAAAVLALVLCTALVLYFTVLAKRGEVNVVDRAPHEWNITREDWLARDPMSNRTVDNFAPVKLVVVQHTVSPECHRFTNCAAALRNLQAYYMDSPTLGYDLPYNFMIGNDGRVYQARGWDREGAHTAGYNRCSLGVAFIGDYRSELPINSRVTDLQMERFNMLLAEGVEHGFLRADYSVVGAMDVQTTESPGGNLYQALRAMDHFEKTYSFRGMTCEAIYDKLGIPYKS